MGKNLKDIMDKDIEHCISLLNATIVSLGIATKSTAQKIATIVSEQDITLLDMLFFLPIKYIGKIPLKDSPLMNGTVITTTVTITRHRGQPFYFNRKKYNSSHKTIYRIDCVDQDGRNIELIFFRIYPTQITNLAIGTTHTLEGKIELKDEGYKIIHPTFLKTPSKGPAINYPLNMVINNNDTNSNKEAIENQNIMDINPIYRSASTLTQSQIKEVIKLCLEKVSDISIPEWQENNDIANLPSFMSSLKALHQPSSVNDIAFNSLYRQRLAYDELLAIQLSISLLRMRLSDKNFVIVKPNSNLKSILFSRLPFSLNQFQLNVIEEIEKDQKKEKRMFRLLQGDVGSGKTIVALAAILNTIASNYNAILMVPTTVLATQHYNLISKLTEGLIQVELLTGKATKKETARIISNLKKNKINLLVCTHAILYSAINLSEVGLFVIDEQHRFGVKQRAALFDKNQKADILMLTATPIPRTLSMMIYGDIEVSVIPERPALFKTVDTRIMNAAKIPSLIESLRTILKKEEKIYWICPAIEDNENSENAAAIARFDELKKIFPTITGLVHGKMKVNEREKIMEDFRSGNIHILISTTVIEVGIDVPQATVIVIEQAEKFGLSQLHQLRGRVGRSPAQSFCFLLYSDKASDTARERLLILKNNNNGFKIAEEDLRLRGSGDISGVRQSGFEEFRFANISRDSHLLPSITANVQKIINQDNKNEMKIVPLIMKIMGKEYNDQNLG